MIGHKIDISVYNNLIATLVLIFSIISFVVTRNRAKKDRIVSDARYEEQRRISEEPYLVFKASKVISQITKEQVIIRMEFQNKGRGSAYDIVPDTECLALLNTGEKITVYRYGAVEDPIATVGEIFAVKWTYLSNKIYPFRMEPTITFKDVSGKNIDKHIVLILSMSWVMRIF